MVTLLILTFVRFQLKQHVTMEHLAGATTMLLNVFAFTAIPATAARFLQVYLLNCIGHPILDIALLFQGIFLFTNTYMSIFLHYVIDDHTAPTTASPTTAVPITSGTGMSVITYFTQ